MVNLRNWKFPQLFHNHILTCLPVLVKLSEYLYKLSLLLVTPFNFNSAIHAVYYEIYKHSS